MGLDRSDERLAVLLDGTGFSRTTSNMVGMLGPWMSASIDPTRWPRRPVPPPRLAVTVLLPTPPFPEAMAITCFTPGKTFPGVQRPFFLGQGDHLDLGGDGRTEPRGELFQGELHGLRIR